MSSRATQSYIMPDLHSSSLLSIGQLCDEDYSAVFTKNHVKIFDNSNNLAIIGQRNRQDGLWDVNFQSKLQQSHPQLQLPSPTANVILRHNMSDSNLAAFLHATAGCPTKTTFIAAIQNGNFTTWPGLTTSLIAKHLLPTIATGKGHMKQEQQRLKSTRLESPIIPDLPSSEDNIVQEERRHECYITITSAKPSGTTYSDITGRFPVKSSRGNQYLVICYDFDTNYIAVKPTKSRQGFEIRDTIISLIQKFKASGNPPRLHILDNEASHALKSTLLKSKIDYQLVPPHVHRRNAAERAIQTFKAHFITTLCIADPTFPANEWDRLLPQAELTLNLLRNCRYNPRLSAYSALHGPFDFNRTPLAPPGTKILIHEKPSNRGSWSPRGTEAWYIGPALKHYRCVTCFIPDTQSTRIADTVEYFHPTVPIPQLRTEDLIRNAVEDLVTALTLNKTALPPIIEQPSTHKALTELTTILNQPHSSPRVRTPNLSTDHKLNHIYNPDTGIKLTYDSLRKLDKDRWETSFANEIGRLAQGVGERMKSGNDNMFFIPKSAIPANRKVTYANPVCDYRPLKDEPYRVRLVVGGDRLNYDADTGAPTANLLDVKILLNSIISTPGARFATIDIKDFFLCTPMAIYEYIKIPFRWIPEEIRLQYNLYSLVDDHGYVYCEVRKGMYGLKQAARLAYDNLVSNLGPDGYYPVRACPGLWKHTSRPTVFSLCVDDFGVKHQSNDDLNHLLDTLRKHYKCTIDKEGKNYLGLTLSWNYADRYVDVSMPGYIRAACQRFKHPQPKRPQFSPHPWQPPKYGQHIQYADHPTSPALDKTDTTYVQSVNGTLIYYGRAVDPTILPAVNEISTQQSAPTQHTKNLCHHLLDYLATYPNATIRFHASDMIAVCETDAAYLVLPKARSRIAGHYYFTNRQDDYSKGTITSNGPFHTECKALRRVVSSAAEAETGGAFENSLNLVSIRRICEQVFNHPQPRKGSPLITDNSTSTGILTRLIKPRRSKSWDMRHHWLEDRIQDNTIQLIWRPGKLNRADYFTKHHAPSHHRKMRTEYLVNVIQRHQKKFIDEYYTKENMNIIQATEKSRNARS